MKLKRQLFVLLWSMGAERVSKTPEYACVHRSNCFMRYKTCLTHPKSWVSGRSKELEDVGRVASSFLTYLGKIGATLLAGYILHRPEFELSDGQCKTQTAAYCFHHANQNMTTIVPLFSNPKNNSLQSVCSLHFIQPHCQVGHSILPHPTFPKMAGIQTLTFLLVSFEK